MPAHEIEKREVYAIRQGLSRSKQKKTVQAETCPCIQKAFVETWTK